MGFLPGKMRSRGIKDGLAQKNLEMKIFFRILIEVHQLKSQKMSHTLLKKAVKKKFQEQVTLKADQVTQH